MSGLATAGTFSVRFPCFDLNNLCGVGQQQMDRPVPGCFGGIQSTWLREVRSNTYNARIESCTCDRRVKHLCHTEASFVAAENFNFLSVENKPHRVVDRQTVVISGSSPPNGRTHTGAVRTLLALDYVRATIEILIFKVGLLSWFEG